MLHAWRRTGAGFTSLWEVLVMVVGWLMIWAAVS